MPLVKIHLIKGKSEQYKRAIADGIHAALVAAANVPPADRFQLIFEYEQTAIIADPAYAGASRSLNCVIIEIVLNSGRSLETKKDLYAAIAKNLSENPKLRGDDVMISLQEVTKENWSFARGIAQYA